MPLTDEAGSLTGPFNAMLFAPSIGGPMQRLGASIRFSGALTPRAREIIILTVAAYRGSAYEQRIHERIGAAAGLSEATLRALRESRTPQLEAIDEQTAFEVSTQLLRQEDLSPALLSQALDVLGVGQLYELVAVVGYYSLVAMQIRLFADA